MQFQGERKTQRGWSKHFGISPKTFRSWKAKGLTMLQIKYKAKKKKEKETAIIYTGEAVTLSRCAELMDISFYTLKKRIKFFHLEPEKITDLNYSLPKPFYPKSPTYYKVGSKYFTLKEASIRFKISYKKLYYGVHIRNVLLEKYLKREGKYIT